MRRTKHLFASALGIALLGGCAVDTNENAHALTGGSACDGVQLDASRFYKPKSWTDAVVDFDVGSLTFAIPSSIPVTAGQADHGKAKLTFSLGAGDPIVCVYRGNGTNQYDFRKCKRGDVQSPDPDDDDQDHDDGPADPLPSAGSVVTADYFKLHVNRGNKKAGTTTISLHLGGPVIDDGDACTTDACTNAGGVTHTPVDTDDGNECTTDACDPATGTSHTLVETPVCRGEVAFNDGDLVGLGGNGRACSTCHVESTSWQLSPENVESRYQSFIGGTDDPLFRPIDADDFRINGNAANNFTNLRRGLVRITFTLPANVKVLDCGSAIPCPASALPTTETTVDVWRSVPTVFNVAGTGSNGVAPFWPRAPNTSGGYQLDGRVDTLQNQALGALQNHAQVTTNPAQQFLDDVAAFQQSQNTPAEGPLTEEEALGKTVFNRACGQCHGGPNFSNASVTGRYVDIRTAFPRPADTVSPPRWRFAAPTQLAGNVRTYEFTFADGFKVRKTTTDPGRALLSGFVFSAVAPVPPATCAHPPCGAGTGDDFQKLDITGLRNIRNTAPYFHNNSAATLVDVLDHYDQLFLQLRFTNATSPVIVSTPGGPIDRPVKLPTEDGGVERAALLAYLQRI